MQKRSAVRWLFGSLALALSAPAPALATEGVLEINQTCAVNTGCFSGDSAGFPVTITAAGSYRLTSNLSVSDEHTNVMTVAAHDVGIDLNGFAITGPVTCSGTPLSCSHASGTGSGVVYSSSLFQGTALTNGSVAGMGSYGVQLGPQAVVTSLRARENRTAGIWVGNGSTVSENSAHRNGAHGIYAAGSSTVSGNAAYDNGEDGIRASNGVIVSGNTANRNGIRGITAYAGSNVSRNVVYSNADAGIYAFGSVTLSDNTANSNGGIGIYAGGGSVVSGNTVRSNGDDGIGAAAGSSVFDNVALFNGVYGIDLLSAFGAAYRGNVIYGNTSGGVVGGTNLGSNHCSGTGVASASCP